MAIKLQIRGFQLSEDNPWDAKQIRDFCLQAIENIGGEGAWNILSLPLKRAVVAQRAFQVITSSFTLTSAHEMDCLLHDMERLLGLAGE